MRILELDCHAQRHAFMTSINSRKALIAADSICDTLPVKPKGLRQFHIVKLFYII